MPATKEIHRLSNKATNMLNPSNFGYLESMEISLEKAIKSIDLDVELGEDAKNELIETLSTRLTEFRAARTVMTATLESIARYKFNPPVKAKT